MGRILRTGGHITKANLLATTAMVVALPFVSPHIATAQVTADGRTATSITRNGATANVRTGTIANNHGVNSFSSFNVRQGATVNLHAPNGTRGTVNIVNGAQAQIHGMVRGMQNGAVGGEVYIAAPNGVVVGPTGTIRAGSIGLSTPSQSVVNNLFGTGGSVNPQGIGQIIDGTVPLGPGNIAVNGALTADQRVRLRAGGQVGVNGAVTAGQSVDIYGQQGVTFGGSANVTAQHNGTGGTVRVRSGGDIVLERGAKILAQSTGSADAGVIDIYADGSALLSQGAVISAAADGSGTGGFVEFSATNTVEALGDLEAFSAEGQGGKILIDPLHAVLTGMSTNGADYEVIATETITLQSGAIINTVSAGGSAGDVTLTAPQITLESGSQIIATDGTNPGGAVHIEARIDDRLTDETTAPGDVSQNALPIGHAKISITEAIIRGGTVDITATTYKDNKVDVESATDTYLNSLAGPLGDFEAVQDVLALASEIGSAAQAQLDKIDIENLPMFLDAHATIEIDGSHIIADEDANVIATATTHFEIAPENQNVALAIAASNTVARTTVHHTAIDVGGNIQVHAVVNEEQTLIAKSGVSDPDVDPTAFNLAVATSLRRSRAETIVNGLRPPIAFSNPGTYYPWRTGRDPRDYTTLRAEGSIDIASLTTRDILMTSDAVVSDAAKGAALAISLENSRTNTWLGGAIGSLASDIHVRAETTVERFGSRARVSGGSEAVENVDPNKDNQGVDPDDQNSLAPDVTDVALGTFTLTDAVNAALSSKMDGGGSGGSGGDESDSRFALAGTIIVHSTQSNVEAGGDHEYEAPDGTTATLIAPYLGATEDGGSADSDYIDLTEEPKMTYTARNVLKDVRVETLTQVGSVPLPPPDPEDGEPDPEGDLTGDTAEELAVDGKQVLLVSAGITQWGLGATVTVDDGDPQERSGNVRSVSDTEVIAENVFEKTEGRDEVGSWWGEYREALEQTESDDPADLPEDGGADEDDPDAGDGGDGGGDGGDEAGDGNGGGGGLPGGGSNRPGRKGAIGNLADGSDGSLTGEKDADPDEGATDPEEGDTDPNPVEDAPEDADDPVAQIPTDTRMFVAETTGRGSEVGAGINILSTNFELTAEARVENADFERETYFWYGDDASGENEEAGLSLIARNTGDIIASAGLPGTSTGGEKGGYGGALALMDVNATARTFVGPDARIQLEEVDQRSEQDLLLINTARAHAQNDDGGTGLNIAVAITNYVANTDAINNADEIYGDESLTIRADDKTSVVTLAGSGSLDADKGFAIGVAVNLTDRETRTVLTAPNINMEKDIDIGASTTGSILAAGTASAQDSLPDEEETPDDPDTPEDESQAEIPDEDPDETPVDLSSDLFGDKADDVAEAMGNGDDGTAPDPGDGGAGDSGGGTKTFSFAGDFAATFGTVTTEILIEDAEIASEFEQKIEISALTDVEYGQASSVTASAVDGVGIAGSFGLSFIDHETRADVLSSDIFVYEDEASDGEGVTSITARDTSVFDTLVTGRAAHSEDAWGVAVSASFNQFKSAASVDIEDTKITNGYFFDFSFGEGEGEGGFEGLPGEGGYEGEGGLEGLPGEGDYEGEGGEGDYTCVDEICSDNTVGREILIHAEALPVSTVTVFAARDAVGTENSGDQQMDKMSDQMEDAAKQAEEPQDQAPDPGGDPDPGATDPDADAGGDQPDEEKGKGRKGVSISIAPSVVHADASVTITDSFFVADRDLPDPQSPGKIDVLSKAVTTSNVDASAGTVGLSFAMTDTNSVVWIQNSDLLAPGNGSVSIRSEVGEVQEVSARVESDSRVKVAGILSLRDAVNRVIIDGGANTGTVISGGTGVTISATTTHDLGFTAHASDSTSLVLAGAGIVSLGDADTAVFMGGEAISDGAVGISASDTTTRYEAEAIVTTGALTDEELDEEIEEGGGPDKPKTPFGKRDKAETPDESSGANEGGGLTDAIANIADEQTEKAEDTAEDETGTGDDTQDDEKKAGSAISFAIAINADRMDTTVTALIGGTVTGDQIAGDLDLSEARLTGADVTLAASQDLSQYRKVTATKAGSLDDKVGFVGTFSYGFIGSAVTARVDPTLGPLGASDLTVRATNALPTNSIADIQNPLNDTTLGLKTIDDSEALLAGDLLPDPALEMDQETWNILNRTEGQAGVGIAVDIGIHTAKLDTVAEISDDANLGSGPAVTLEASNEGGLIALRDIPVEESVAPEKQDDVDPPATIPVDGLTDEIPGDDVSKDDRDDARDEKERTMGTVGIGGALQYLRLDANATARFGEVQTNGSVNLDSLDVSASNDMQGIVVTKSFGAAENVAFNGGFSILDYRGDARALVDDRNPLVVGDFTTINAEDMARLLAFGGAGSQAGKVAVGLGAGIIFADRSAFGAVTSATAVDILANVEGSAGAPDLTLGDLSITTETGGFSVAGASAGAEGIEDEAAEEPTPDDPDTPEDESEEGKKRGKIGLPTELTADREDENEEGLGEQTTTDDTGQDEVSGKAFGFALAADFGGVFGTNTAVSTLATDGTVTLDSLTLEAENTADALIGTGAFIGTGGNIGLAGAVSVSDVKTEVHALAASGTLTLNDGDIALSATDAGDLLAASVGRGGAGSTFSLVGSGTLHLGRSVVEAKIVDSKIEEAGDVTLEAELTGATVAVAGSLAREVAEEARDEKLGDDNDETAQDYIDDVNPFGEDEPLSDDTPDAPDAGGDGGTDDPQQDEGESNSIGVGISYAQNTRRETVTTEIVRTDVTANSVELDATNARQIDGVAAATGDDPNIGISASVVVNVLNQTTEARVVGSGSDALAIDVNENVSIRAENSSDAGITVGFSGAGSAFALGLTGGAQVDNRTTLASMQYVTGDTDTAAARARNTGIADISLSSGLASNNEGDEDGGFAVNIPVSILTTSWDTRGTIDDVNIDAGGSVTASAFENAQVKNRQGAVTASGNLAGTVGVAITNYNADTLALITDSVIDASTVSASATTQTLLRAVAIRDGETQYGIDVITAILRGNGETRAEIDDTAITAGAIDIDALDGTRHDVFANGYSENSGAGASGGVGVDLYKRDLIARLSDGFATTTGDIDVDARSELKATNVILGHNGGASGLFEESNSVTGLANVAWTTDARDVIAEIDTVAVDAGGSVHVTASREDTFLSVEAGANRSAKGVGVGAGILKFHGLTWARIVGNRALEVDGDVMLTAENLTEVLQVGIGVTISGGFAAVGSFGYVDFGQRSDDLGQVDGDPRGVLLRDLVEDALNEGTDFVEDNTTLTLPDFDLTRESLIEARLDVDTARVDIGGNLELEAVDGREADVISGQVSAAVDISLANFFLDMWTVERDPDTGKFRVAKRPDAPESEANASEQDEKEVDAGDDSEGADSFDQADSANADGQSNEGDSGGGEDSSPISFGLGVSWVRVGGEVDAIIDLENSGVFAVAEDTELVARSETKVMTASAGAAVFGNALGAGGAITRQAQLVRARVVGDGHLNTGGIGLTATSDNSMWSMAGVLSIGEDLGFGATLALNEMLARTQTRISDDANIYTTGGDVQLAARDDTRVVSMGVAGVGSVNSTGISAANGLVFNRSAVDALIDGGTFIDSAANVSAEAIRSQELAGLAYQVVIASSVGAGGALGLAVDKAFTTAKIEDSTVRAEDDVIVRAQNNTKVVSSGMGGGYGGSAGVTGSVSITIKNDTTTALISNAIVQGGDVLVEALNGGRIDSIGGGEESFFGSFDQATLNVTIGNSAAVGVSVAVIDSASVVTAEITDDSVVTATNDAGEDGVTGTHRDEDGDLWLDREAHSYHGVAVVADNSTEFNTLAMTGSGSAGVSVSAQIPVLFVEDSVVAQIAGGADVTSASDVDVFAANATKIKSISVTASFGTTAGIGAHNEFFRIEKNTVAGIQLADVSAARDVTVEAVTPESMSHFAVSGAVGIYAGVAGVNQVGITRSRTHAYIADAAVASGRDTSIIATAPRQSRMTAGSGGGGFVGVGASIVILDARDEVVAETTASNSASSGYADLTVGRDLLVRADAQTDPSEKVPFVNGQNGEGSYSVNQVVIGTGGGLVGIAGAGLYTSARQSVTARIGDYTRIHGPDLNDVTVEAHQSFGQDVFVLTAAGGAISVGAAGVITSMRNAVLAEVGQGVSIAANGDVTVNAYGERDFTGAVVAGGGGAISAQGSGILLTYGKRVRIDDPDEETPDWQQQIDDADDNLQDDTFTNSDDEDAGDETYNVSQGANPGGPQDGHDNLLATMLGKVTTGRRSINLENSFNGTDEDTIETRIGANVTISAANVALGSEEGGRLDILAGGASGGAISATHGVAIVRRGTTVVTNLGANVEIDARAGNVNIGALANVDDGTPEAIAGSGGAIASSMGIVDMRVGRAVNVNIGDNAIIKASGLFIEAEESSATEAKVSAGVGGAIGVGVAIAGARRESTVGVKLGYLGQAPELDAGTIVVEARRFGETNATVDLVASGAIGVGGTSAVARDLSVVSVDLGNARVTGSDVTVRAINAGDVLASAFGVVGGAGTTGLNSAVARRESETAIKGQGLSLDVGNITVLATDNVPGSENATISADATSTTISGGSLNGSNTLARNDSDVSADLRFSQFKVGGDAWLEARNEADLEYLSKGVTASLVGLGASLARGIDNSSSILDVYFSTQASVDGTFTARSGGDGYLFGNSVSGKGGIVSVFASENLLTMNLTTELHLDGAGLTATNIDIASNRDIMFESNSDSLEVSLVGYGATRQINRVDSDNLLDIGLDLTGETVDIASTNDITKRAIDFNGVTGSFGGLNRSALVSRTEVESDAQINIGPGVTITQVSTTPSPLDDTGYVSIAMRTSYDLTDRLTGDMGGAVPLPKLVSNVIVGAHEDPDVWSSGNIRMTGATIQANGDVNITARADAEMVSESYIRTYGLAGAGQGEAHTILRHSSLIDLASGEIESRRGTVSVLAGADMTGVQEQYQHAESRVHNRTAVPLSSDPDALAELRNKAFIEVGSGMSIVAAGDVNLETGDGITDPYAYGYAVDAYSEAAEAVGNFFGGLIGADEVSLARESGTFQSIDQTGVTVDGSIEAGAFAAKRINIDFAGSGSHPAVNDAGDLIITTEGDISYELEFDRNIGQKILDFIGELEDLRDEYDENSSVYDTLTTQIEALEARYDFLNANGIGQLATDFLYVTDESASGGNVNVTGEYFLGSGSITANGDALIEIVNNSSLSVEVSGLVIPFEDYGEVRYNGVSVDTIGDLVELGANFDPTATGVGQVPTFDLTANHSDVTPPNIIVRNNYTASNSGPTSDVYVVGDVENRNGNVEIFTQDGSVYVFGGDINALSVTIDSGGDFFLAPSDPTTHITSDPTALYADLFQEHEEWWGNVYDLMNDNPALSESWIIQNIAIPVYGPPPAEVLPAVTAPGSVTAVGNIFIYADVLNINGRIQSGVTDWDLTISSAVDTYLDGLGGNTIRPIYAPLRGTPVGSDEDQTNVDVIGAVGNNPPSTLGGEPYMTGNVSVNYNPITDQLEIAPIRTKGGYIEISGKIISTGSGEIIAANGYGTLDIDSNSTRDLVFSHVDLGPDEGVEGVIRIIDKNKPVGNVITVGGQPTYLTTEFRMSESGTNIEVDLSHGTDPAPSSSATYNPDNGLALFFTRAEDHQVVTVRTETQYESRTCFANINCQADETSSTTLVGDGAPVFLDGKPDVGYIGYYYGSNNYTFIEDREGIETTSFSPSGTNPAWTETGWFAPIAPNEWRTRQRDIVTVESTTWRRTFTHRLKADKPIDIDFTGNGYRGDATISSGGSVFFTENVRAPGAGTLTVDAAGDILTVGPETTMTARTAILTSGGDIGGSSSSGLRDRSYRITNPVEGREIFGRRTGADLEAGATAYRNELLGAATSESAAQVAILNGSTVNLTANAQGSIRLRNTTGSYFVNEVVSDYTDDIQIEAEGDIITSVFSDGLIDGGRVTLLSETGRIGRPETEPYGERTLTVNALDEIYVQAYDDIDLSTDYTFEVEEVASQIGNVSLTALSSIQDADNRETVDRRAEAALLGALWDELRLIDNESLRRPTKAEIEERLADIVDEETQAYHDWWSWLVVYDEEGKAEEVRDYDEDLVLQVTEQEKLQLTAKGWDSEEIEALVQERTQAFHDVAEHYADTGYDQDYRYEPTEAQRDAVTADLTQEKLDANPIVQREIANRTAEYQEWWSRLAEIDPDTGKIIEYADYDEGFEAYSYDAERRAEMIANGLTEVEIDALEATQNEWFHNVANRYAGKGYDENYVYAPTEQEVNDLIDSAFFTTTELEAAFRQDLILPVLDTQMTIEEPNVIGRDVTLNAGLDVGKREDSIFLDAGSTITKEERLWLFSAARSDVQIEANGVRILRNEDFDIEASGDVTVQAGRHAYVGSETDVAITAFEATQDARLRTSGAITATVGGTGVIGRSVSLEAAGGGIGSLATPLLYEQLSGGTLSARAAGEIHLFAGSSDISIEEIYSPERVYLEAKAGQILDADPSSVIDILSRGVWLKSLGAMDLEVELTQPGAAIFAEAGGDLDLEVVGGEIALERVASTGGFMSFTNWNGGATVVHPSSASSAEGMSAFQGQTGITAWINGDITETSGLWTTFRSEGKVDLTTYGTAGDDTRALSIVADELALNLMPGAGELNANFAAFGDLTVSKLNAGTGDVTVTASGHLLNDLDGGSFNSLTMRTVGDFGAASDIIFLRDFTTTASQTFSAAAARNVNLGSHALAFFGETEIVAGLRGVGSAAGATTNIIKGGTNTIEIAAADNVRLFGVEHDGLLDIETQNGGVLLANVEAASLAVRTGDTGDVVGQVTASDVTLDIGTVGAGGTGMTLGGDATNLSLDVTGEAWIAPLEDLELNVTSLKSGIGPVVINGQDSTIRLSGAANVGGDLFIGADDVFVDKTITGTADGSSSAGQITIEARNDITFADGADIDAGQGYIDLEAGNTLQIAGLSSAQSGVGTISMTATTLTPGDGLVSAENGQLVVNASSVGTATDPLVFDADRLWLTLGQGPAYFFSNGDVELQNLSGTSGHYDLVSQGDIYMSGPITVERDAVVIATSANGDILADEREPVSLSGNVFLTSITGRIGGVGSTTPFALKTTENLAVLNAAAFAPIHLYGSGDLAMGYAVSQDGDVSIRVDGELDLALAGTKNGLTLDVDDLADMPQHGADEALDTTPISAAPVQNADDYPLFNVFGPDGDGGDTSGGDTGGGDTGGGDNGGGDTGGGDTGGGDTGGGDTGGGDTGGGDTGGGDTGGGDTGGGDTGGGDTGGGDTGGGDTGGGDTGGNDTGGTTTDPDRRTGTDPRIQTKSQGNPLPGAFSFDTDRGEDDEEEDEEDEETAEDDGEGETGEDGDDEEAA